MALAMALWDSLDEEGRSDALPLDDELSADLGLAFAEAIATVIVRIEHDPALFPRVHGEGPSPVDASSAVLTQASNCER